MSTEGEERVLCIGPGENATSVAASARDGGADCDWEFDIASALNHMKGALLGTTLLIPAYRLEEVEEIIEPEKPGVPVEPYVGLSWTNDDETTRVVLAVSCSTIDYVHNAFSKWSVISDARSRLSDIPGYPHTSSTPAVTRRQKKWVKIEHSPKEPSP